MMDHVAEKFKMRLSVFERVSVVPSMQQKIQTTLYLVAQDALGVVDGHARSLNVLSVDGV